MHHFLIYVAAGGDAALEAIGRLGTLRRADVNISVLETEEAGVRIETELGTRLPPGTNFLVARVHTLGRDGDAQFLSSLEHVMERD